MERDEKCQFYMTLNDVPSKFYLRGSHLAFTLNASKKKLTLSKSAKSDNSSQRFLITFWYSANLV